MQARTPELMPLLDAKFEIKNEVRPVSSRGRAAYRDSSGKETKEAGLGHTPRYTLGDFTPFLSVLFFLIVWILLGFSLPSCIKDSTYIF